MKMVFIPLLLSDWESTLRQGNLLQWLSVAHFVPVPADCGSRWVDWQWSPLRGSSEQVLHHPVGQDDPPFATAGRRGIVEWQVRGRERSEKRTTEQLSISILGPKIENTDWMAWT